MHTINLVGKAHIIQVDCESIVVRNGKKHSHSKVSCNYLGSPTQADHNSRRLQYSRVLFILFSCFSCGIFGKPLVTSNV